MATSDKEDLHSELFIKRKAYNVRLSNGLLSWCRCDSLSANKGHSYHCHSLNLKRVLAIVPHNTEIFGEHHNDIELDTLQPVNNFRSFYLYIIIKKGNHKWLNRKLYFDCGNIVTGSQWITRIQNELSELDRPKNLLVFVNPHGGRRQAPKIFKNKVKPLLDLAKIRTEVIKTTRADHAKDFILSENNLIRQYDGIISVGGDGMFSEILNGTLLREEQERKSSQETVFNPQNPGIKLGIIPAGSTDCVCYCTTGTIDAVTSTLQIIVGETLPIDISSIRSGEQLLRFSVSFAGYGFFGDVLKDSEKLRWVGVQRYDISGAKTFLANRFYEGELSYLISSDVQGHPKDKSKCRAGCSICSPPPHTAFGELVPAESLGWHSTSGRFISVIGATNCCANLKSPEGLSPSAHLADGFIDLVVVRHTSRAQYLRHMIRLAGRADHFDFEFVEVHRVKEFSFRSLCYGKEDQEEMDFGSHSKRRSQKNATLTKTRKGYHHHSTQRKSVWNVDGEIIDEPSVHVRVHRQLVTLFAHGIEECDKSTTCTVCRRL